MGRDTGATIVEVARSIPMGDRGRRGGRISLASRSFGGGGARFFLFGFTTGEGRLRRGGATGLSLFSMTSSLRMASASSETSLTSESR